MSDRIETGPASSKTTFRPETLPEVRRSPSSLVTTFWAVVTANLLLIYLAFEVEPTSSSAGGDAAGNAMSNGFQALIEYAALAIVGVPAVLFMLVRKRWFRLTMAVVLGLNALVLLMLASFIHAHP